MTSGYKGAPSASEVTLVLGSASAVLVQGLAPVALGAGLNNEYILTIIILFHCGRP